MNNALPVVLVVDEQFDDCVLLGVTLRRESMEVLTAHSFTEGKALAMSVVPDVVVLDRSFADGSGLELCAQLHEGLTEMTPFLIMLTDQASEADRLLGFEAGVDDYVAKPFSPQEVAFRIRGMLRRRRIRAMTTFVPSQLTNELKIGDLLINPDLREVRVCGELKKLTLVEYEILLALVENRNVVLTRSQLVDKVWNAEWKGDGHALDVHVSNLRRKLSAIPRDQTYVRSIRGVGYRIGPCLPAAIAV
jgi:DNA-binding response OmpR family regulator